jgi:hypothetical protein
VAPFPPRRLAEVVARDPRIVAGLMTGTSMDGLDLVILRVPAGVPRRFELLAHGHEPMPAALRAALAPQGALSLAEACRLDRALGLWFADALEGLVRALELVAEGLERHWESLPPLDPDEPDPAGRYLARVNAVALEAVSGSTSVTRLASHCSAPVRVPIGTARASAWAGSLYELTVSRAMSRMDPFMLTEVVAVTRPL